MISTYGREGKEEASLVEATELQHSGSNSKESACSARDPGSIPELGKSPGREHDIPLQYSCLKNPMDRGAWWATSHTVAKSQTRLK